MMRLLLASIASSSYLVVFIGWAEAFLHYNGHRSFVIKSNRNQYGQSVNNINNIRQPSSTSLLAEINKPSAQEIPAGENYSTLTLLEHLHLLNFNVHKQTTSDSNATLVDFFTNTLGFGMDPKSIDSLLSRKGVVFVNAGPSQLHLNDDSEYCRKIVELQTSTSTLTSRDCGKHPFEIGLRYNSLVTLKKELAKNSEFCSYDVSSLGDGREIIRVTDIYGTVFVAREVMGSADGCKSEKPTISSICQQQIICGDNEEATEVETTCKGIDFIEFFVHVSKEEIGKTAEKIARFYDFFFDAPTSVVNDGKSYIAIIGCGSIDENGRAEQSLLFREVVADDPDSCVAHNDELGTGHHIAIYVGNCDEDFKVAASNCLDGGLMWVNPQFEDVVIDVDAAMDNKQFRFKNIVDIETGEILYVLEHEIRSISHPLFPRKK